MEKIRIAIVGQSNFASDVVEILLEKNYLIVGIFTVPDKGIKEDILATTGRKYDIPVFKIKAWRNKGQIIPEVLKKYQSVEATLNILPFCTQFIPIEVIDGAKLGSICYHPSILPLHRGASAISWTLIKGDDMAGLTIFWADSGLDTGPILLQRQCTVKATDTLDILYKRFLFPEGVKAILMAVDMISNNIAPKIPQREIGATYDPALFKEENQVLKLEQSAEGIFNFIRGLDSTPGAIAFVEARNGNEEMIRLYGAHIYSLKVSDGKLLKLRGSKHPAIVHSEGLLIEGTDKKFVNIKRIKKGNHVIKACNWFKQNKEKPKIEFTKEELNHKETLRQIWESILKICINSETHFFESGAASMDVVRLIEECKDIFDISLENENIFMFPVFDDFFNEIIKYIRGSIDSNSKVYFDGFVLNANKKSISIPTQLFINGHFIDAEDKNFVHIINPTTEEILCQVACASKKDVNKAVEAAEKAFNGPWRHISARDRGQIMFRLADIMEEWQEELATIEAVDSGAVYTLALKTHVGMSINAWRYFAGWTDKIEGNTIPVSPSQPNHILTFTKKEPIGVCALITPWNYPLMMLSWKMAACIAAGNTCVIKPAQVCPLTALKFAELTVKAGFPEGVINVITGLGSLAGQALADHPRVRKLGFTGSTPIGQHIMKSCAQSNLKRSSLELGGKSPLIIFADCDLDKAIKHGASSVFFNKGENCIGAGRLFVEDVIHDDFVRKIIKDIKGMTIGDPLNRSTSHGPQNHRAHFEKLIEFCNIGIKEGATLLYGGKAVHGMKGFFFQPTIFTDVEDHMYVAQEESFGPIMLITKFHGSDIECVMKRANHTEYGLASGVFTQNISKALNFIDNIDAGTIFVNVYNKTDVAAPFGGFKQSGFGKDLGHEALNEYLKIKCVTIEY